MKNELCAIGQVILLGTRIAIPKSLRTRVFELEHEGHSGIVVFKRNLRSNVWWPGMDKNVERECRTCYGCQLVSIPAIHRTQLPSAPWEHLETDCLGPLPSGDSLFVLVVYNSRYKIDEIMKSTTGEKTVSCLKKIFNVHELLLSITTDNGSQFFSEVFSNFMHENQIQHKRTSQLGGLEAKKIPYEEEKNCTE